MKGVINTHRPFSGTRFTDPGGQEAAIVVSQVAFFVEKGKGVEVTFKSGVSLHVAMSFERFSGLYERAMSPDGEHD
jgi:hypothetical protein